MAEIKRKYLSSFAWAEDDNTLHVDVTAFLRELKVADTPDNREAAARIVSEAARTVWPHLKPKHVEVK